MSKLKLFANLMVVAFSLLAANSSISAQNNLTAKANNFQPQPVNSTVESDRIKDGLAGPVRRVRTEIAKLLNANGRPTEDKRVVLETASYDIKGNKTENQYFPVAGSTLTGKEVYKYDEKGNISEMTLLNVDGSLLSKEVYKYDYDFVGNWTKMTTSVAVVEGGKVTFEPSEVTYRSIMYYLDANMLKMAQPSPAPAGADANSTASKTAVTDVKTQPAAPSDTKTSKTANSPNHKTAPSLPSASAATNRSMTVSPAGLTSTSNGGNTDKVILDSEPPPTSGPKPLLKPVSGGVLNGKALSLPAPSYPDNAKRMRTSGTVSVEVVVDENGKVISAQATGGPQALRDAAIQAALKAKFSPTMLSGSPVKVTGEINYKFSLAQ
jgi:TonB family protein